MGRKSLASKGSISYELLYDLYVTQSLSIKAIGEKLGVAQSSVYNYLKSFEIPRRTRGNRRSKGNVAPAPEVMLNQEPTTLAEGSDG